MKPGFRIFALLLFSVTDSTTAYNQQQIIDFRQQFGMPQVLPASPDAAGIEKFGNIPVSYSTGIPDISIPIWNIKCGKSEWPISLSYHSGGIRVDEIASGAGLGWSVNAPGVISRSRAGRPDEESNLEPVYTSISPNDATYLYNVLAGGSDSQQDIFNFNFNGRSGKFIINQDGSVLQIPFSYLKITYTTAFASFAITDENGVTYLFDQTEQTSSQNVPVEPSPALYKSSWYLSKMEMPDKKNTIQFSYTYAGQSSQLFTTFSQAVGYKYTQLIPEVPPVLNDRNDRSLSKVYQNTGMLKLTGITFSNGSIAFGYDATVRLDVSGATADNKLSSITINRTVGSSSVQVKKFDLYQSYFYYNPASLPASNAILYRLRLDSLSESGMSAGPSPKKYKFQYNTTPMVHRESYGQDVWGYNNGYWQNTSLLQSEAISFWNGSATLSYQIGDAGVNRSVDTAQMKACMLSSITYPTGGKTTFTFEPHIYNTELNLTSTTEKETHIIGDQAPQVVPRVSTTTFTVPATAIIGTLRTVVSARVIVDMSMYNFTGVTNPSWVSIKDLTTGALFYVESQTNPNQRVSWNHPIDLDTGHTYELKAYVYTTVANSQLDASIKVTWNNYTTVPDLRRGGGLRIREIKNYTGNGILAGTETYLYDTAVTLTPFYQIERRYSEVFYRLGVTGDHTVCVYYPSPLCRVYSSGPVYAISTAMGSPMLYRNIQKITTDSVTGAINGKSEYQYDVYKDETFPVGGKFTMVPMISNEWQNGFLTTENHYKLSSGSYSLVKKIQTGYGSFNLGQSYSLRVEPRYIREGCSAIQNSTSIDADALYYTFPSRTGSKKLAAQTVTLYDDDQNEIETNNYNYYLSSDHDFPTKTVTVDSKGSSDSTIFKRSPDFSSPGNVYEKMEQQNILAPVIEQKSYNNATLLNTVKNNYRDWNANGKIIALDSIQASVLNNTLETRLKYYAYDTFSNPLSVSKSKDVQVSYIWGYNGAYPIAEVTNSNNTSIAYTPFETDDGGGWTVGSIMKYGDYVTGRWAYDISKGNVTKSSLITTKTYVVSLWAQSGASPLINSLSFGTALLQRNGWNYYEKKIIPSTGTITISGAGIIDELRLYPDGSQMKTFTYNPLTGISSQCDINGNIIYYYYDDLGRLTLVRDQDKNIVKRIYYNYAGQPENSNIWFNSAKSGTYQKTACTGCQMGSSVAYSVAADVYSSSIDQADADSKALAEVFANGQAYANANGSCVAPTSAPLTGSNSKTSTYSVTFHNNCTGINTIFLLTAGMSNAAIGSVLAGNYTVTFDGHNANPYTCKVNGITLWKSAGGQGVITADIATSGATISVTP